MSFDTPNICIHLMIEPYLKQWLINDMGGEPVLFPRGSHERDLLEHFLKERTQADDPDLPTEETVAIQLPKFRDKNVKKYNVLPPRARLAMARAIYIRFRISLWSEIHVLDLGQRNLTDVIYAWMEKHGIELTEQNWQTIRQQYYRMRKVYREKNIE